MELFVILVRCFLKQHVKMETDLIGESAFELFFSALAEKLAYNTPF